MLSKKQERLERKRKKIIALLEVAKLNDEDRAEQVNNHTGKDNKSDSVKKKHKSGRTTSEELPAKKVKSSHSSESTDAEHAGPTEKKPELEGEEYHKLKEHLRERKNLLKKIPRFRLKACGEQARLSEEDDSRTPLFFSDIQHLLVYSMIGNHASYLPARWCHLERPLRLSHVVALVIEGLSATDFKKHSHCFPHITKLFPSSVELVAPSSYGGSTAAELASLPLSFSHRQRLMKKFKSLEALLEKGEVYKAFRAIFPINSENSDVKEVASTNGDQAKENTNSEPVEKPTGDEFPRTELLLSARQMVEEGYPLPLKGELQGRYMNYKLTKDLYTEVTNGSPMFALDCEMCLTTSYLHELTRVSIVNEELEVVYESLVKPRRPIINYMTKVSGITKELLEDVETRIEDVQEAIRDLLPPDAILIGQSLNFDLHALKMMHPYVIDTSVSYNLSGDRRLKSKLSVFSHLFLNEIIQNDKKGHNPTEDSKAAMKLIQLKLSQDLSFGDAVMGGYVPCATNAITPIADQSGYAQRAEEANVNTSDLVVSLFKQIKNEKKSVAVVTDSVTLKEYAKFLNGHDDEDGNDTGVQISHVAVEGGKNIARKIRDISLQHNFTLGHIKLVDGAGEEEEWEDVDTKLHRSDPERLERTMSAIDRWCKRIYKHMAVSGLCVVLFTGLHEDNPAATGQNGACFIEVKSSAYLKTFQNTFRPLP